MFNKRLQHDFEIPNAGLHRVYLLEESDTVVTWPVICGQGEPVRLSFGNRNNSIYTPILPGTLTWRIVIQNQAARDAIDAVFESIEGDYRVEFYQVEGGVTENLIWRGDLLLDQYNEDLRGFPGFVELVANDLASLQGKNYLHTDGFVHTGRETQLQIIKNCVQLLGYDLGFACSDAIYEDTMDGDPLTDDPMLQAYADNAWYYPVDQFLQTRLMSAWDVLSSILISKACRIRQWGGRWYVEQLGEGLIKPSGLILIGQEGEYSGGSVIIANHAIYNANDQKVLEFNVSTSASNQPPRVYFGHQYILSSMGPIGSNNWILTLLTHQGDVVRQLSPTSIAKGFEILIDKDNYIYVFGDTAANGLRKLDLEFNEIWHWQNPDVNFRVSSFDVYPDGDVAIVSGTHGDTDSGQTALHVIDADKNDLWNIPVLRSPSEFNSSGRGWVRFDMDKNLHVSTAGWSANANGMRSLFKFNPFGARIYQKYIPPEGAPMRTVAVDSDNNVYYRKTVSDSGGGKLRSRNSDGITIERTDIDVGVSGDLVLEVDSLGSLFHVRDAANALYVRRDAITLGVVREVTAEKTGFVATLSPHPGRLVSYNGRPVTIWGPLVFPNDYNGETIGAGLPDGYEGTWNTGNTTHSIESNGDGLGNKVYQQIVGSTGGSNPRLFFPVIAEMIEKTRTQNFNILVKVKITGIAANRTVGIGYMKYNSTFADANGLVLVYRHGVGIEFGTYSGGTFTSLYTNNTGFGDSTDAIWLRLVKDGDDFSGYAWFDGDAEPVSFTTFWAGLTGQITDLGRWGIFTRTPGTYQIDFFGIGINGGVPLGNDSYPTITNTEGVDGGIKIDWIAPVVTTGLLGYDIYVDSVKENGDPLDVLTYTKTGLTNGTNYELKLVAVYDTGHEFSREVTIKAGLFISTDFTEYTNNTFPSDWINIYQAAGWRVLSNILTSDSTNQVQAIGWDEDSNGIRFANAIISAKVRTNNAASTGRNRLFVRADGVSGTVVGIDNGYYLGLSGGTTIQLVRMINNAFTVIDSAAFAYSSATWYWLKIETDGSDFRCKAWADGDPEPGTWAITASDATFASGYVGLGKGNNIMECDEIIIEELP